MNKIDTNWFNSTRFIRFYAVLMGYSICLVICYIVIQHYPDWYWYELILRAIEFNLGPPAHILPSLLIILGLIYLILSPQVASFISIKLSGVLLGVIGIILWFTPFTYIYFMGTEAYQAGQHIGGIAYLLLFASIGYSIFFWFNQYQLAIIASVLGISICCLFAIQSGIAIAWGLWTLIMLWSISFGIAFYLNNQGNNFAIEVPVSEEKHNVAT